MLSLTIDQLNRILDHIASQLATLERIQSVNTMATMPTTTTTTTTKNEGVAR